MTPQWTGSGDTLALWFLSLNCEFNHFICDSLSLSHSVGDYILETKPKEISEAQRLNYEQVRPAYLKDCHLTPVGYLPLYIDREHNVVHFPCTVLKTP